MYVFSFCFCCLAVYNVCVWYIAFPLDPAVDGHIKVCIGWQRKIVNETGPEGNGGQIDGYRRMWNGSRGGEGIGLEQSLLFN